MSSLHADLTHMSNSSIILREVWLFLQVEVLIPDIGIEFCGFAASEHILHSWVSFVVGFSGYFVYNNALGLFLNTSLLPPL